MALKMGRIAALLALPALLALALPAQAQPERADWMTGGGYVDVGQDPDTFRVRLGLDLPCVPGDDTTTSNNDRFEVTWPGHSFRLDEMTEAKCTPNSPPASGGSHDGAGNGTCHASGPLGMPAAIPATIDWDLNDGGVTPAAPPRGRPTTPPQPTMHPDMVAFEIKDNSSLFTCDLAVPKSTLQGGELRLHSTTR